MKIAVIEIKGCGECGYILEGLVEWWCNTFLNKRSSDDSKVDPETIPEWCPLPDKEA